MIIYIALSVFFGWLIFLTILVVLIRRHYFKLISGTRKERIDEVLESLIDAYSGSRKEVEELRHTVDAEIKDSQYHLQKVNIIRFNPFEKSGEQSFVLALLDKEKNGVIINFMYTSDGLRAFTKKVKAGKGEDYSLSEEEQKAVTAA